MGKKEKRSPQLRTPEGTKDCKSIPQLLYAIEPS